MKGFLIGFSRKMPDGRSEVGIVEGEARAIHLSQLLLEASRSIPKLGAADVLVMVEVGKHPELEAKIRAEFQDVELQEVKL